MSWTCRNCQQRADRWSAKCPKCGQWRSLEEEGKKVWTGTSLHPVPVRVAAEQPDPERLDTGLGGFDLVLGGGIVRQSVVLLAGEPGAGKSTLLAQVAGRVARGHGPVLYVSGEETLAQVGLRARRVKAEADDFTLVAEQDLDRVVHHVEHNRVDLLVVDSVQRVRTASSPGQMGTVEQVKGVCGLLCGLARDADTSVLLIGHVTKDGDLAGPKALEHLVDVVLTLEVGEGATRLLRANKNRYGSTLEVGEFAMTEGGLR